MTQMLRGRAEMWVHLGLLALAAFPTAACAAALAFNTDMLCIPSGTPLGTPFLAGHAWISTAGDLTAQLTGVIPNVSWHCEGNCLIPESLTFGTSVRVDNCAVSNQQGVLHVRVPGFFTPLVESRGGICLSPVLSIAGGSNPSVNCLNGFGEVEP